MTRSRWVASIAALVLLTEQSALGFQIIAPALVLISTQYQTTQAIWVITIFLLIGSVATPIAGKLGDRYGKKKVLVGVAIVTTIGCVISALAPNFTLILVGRAIAGVMLAFTPLSYALARDVFPERVRGVSIGILTNGVGIVGIVGPLLAGVLIDNLSLSAVFWFSGALALVGGVATVAVLRESPIRVRERIDVLGAVLLAAGLFLIMLGGSELGTWSAGAVAGCIVGGLVILAGWWWHERRVSAPFIDTRLLADRRIAMPILAFALALGAVSTASSYVPLFLQTPREITGGAYGFGLTAVQVGLVLIPSGIVIVAAGFVVGLGARRWGWRRFSLIAPLFTIVGALALGLFRDDLWVVIAVLAFYWVGSMSFASGPGLLMEVAPAAARGVSAAMMTSIGGVIGAVLAQLGALILNSNIGQVVGGFPTYTAAGIVWFFVYVAVVAALAIVVGALIPRRETVVEDTGDAPDLAKAEA